MKKRRVYMDYAATSPVAPEVINAMLPYLNKVYGNASSLHSWGQEAHEAMERSREKIASILGATKEEIIFTAGGTESDNLALRGIAYKRKQEITDTQGPHIITSAIEHPAVMETCKRLESEGFVVKYVPVDKYGRVNPEEVERSIRKGTFLISIMHANNEIGTIEPIEEIAKIAKKHDIVFHTDAVQTFTKLPLDVNKMSINLLSISAHKIRGPKGVGALYVRRGTALEPIVYGGGHEHGLRSSTENVAGIVGLGKAAELAAKQMDKERIRLTRLRDKLIEGVIEEIEEAYLNGHPTQRLPNNAHFRFSGIEGESLVLSLDDYGIAASTGSACSSKKLEPSHVLIAIGLNEVEAHGSLRLTLGRENSEEDVNYLLGTLPKVVAKLRKGSPLWGKEGKLKKWKGTIEKRGNVYR